MVLAIGVLAINPTATQCSQNRSLRPVQEHFQRNPLEVEASSVLLGLPFLYSTIASKLKVLVLEKVTLPFLAMSLPYRKLDRDASFSS